jgi:hypothetical protein
MLERIANEIPYCQAVVKENVKKRRKIRNLTSSAR